MYKHSLTLGIDGTKLGTSYRVIIESKTQVLTEEEVRTAFKAQEPGFERDQLLAGNCVYLCHFFVKI